MWQIVTVRFGVAREVLDAPPCRARRATLILVAMTFALVEPDPSATPCARCHEALAEVALQNTSQPRRRYHVSCAIDVDAASARDALESPRVPVENHAALLALARARVVAEQDANRLRKKSKDSASIEPARDRKGRPRVRVVCARSRDGSVLPTGAGYFDSDAITDDATLVSSTREYVIVHHRKRDDLRLDPAQPWAAAIYWQDSSGAVSSGNAKLIEWNSLQLPSPVLVLVGDAADDPSRRDALVLKLRALMSKCGFDPDACPVVTGSRADSAFRDQLLLALDEQATHATAVTKARRVERMGDTLDTLIAEGREEAIVLAIARASKLLRRARAEERERTLASIEHALRTYPQLAGKALTPLLRNAVELPRERVGPIVLAMIALPQLPARTEDWLRVWRDTTGEKAGFAPAVRAVIDADPESKKSEALRTMFRRVGLALEAR